MTTRQFKTLDACFEEMEDGKTFKHVFEYYIDAELTMDQWIELDSLFDEVFDKMGIGDDVVGLAGPIPFEDEKTPKRRES